MENKLGVDNAKRIEYQQVHRMGKPKDKGIRVVIARFLRFPEKERILSLGRNLEDENTSVFSDFPDAIQQSQQLQLKKLKEAWENGKTAHFGRSMPDILFINGHLIPE